MPNILNNLMNALGQKKQPPQHVAAKPQQQTQNPLGALLNKLTNMENKIDNLTVRNQMMNSQPSLANSNTMTNQLFEKVMAAANSLKGTPYKWGGEGKGGIDCSAFVKTVMKSAGLNLPRTAREQWHSTKGTLVSNDYDPAKMQPGDLIFFKNTTGKTPSGEASHVGIYLGNGKMYHSGGSTNGVGIVDVSKYLRGKWLGVTRPAGNALAMSSMPSMTNAQAFSNNLYTGASNFGIIQNQNLNASIDMDFNFASKSPQQVYNQIKTIAQSLGDKHPEITAAQFCLESGFGKKTSGKFNYFGVKGKGSSVMTHEEINGKKVAMKQSFRDYSSPIESIKDHIRLKMTSKYYTGYSVADTTSSALAALKQYATGSSYLADVQKLINRYNGNVNTMNNTTVASNSNKVQSSNASSKKDKAGKDKQNSKPKPKTNTVAKKTVPKNNMMADAKKAIQQKTPNKATASASKAKSR